MDDKIKALLQELGAAINESISGSEDVNRHIERIRDEGYDLYVVLDATIGLNRHEPETAGEESTALVPVNPVREVQFRINVNDLNMLRSMGIDPTRKVRGARRVDPLTASSGDPASQEE